MLTRGFAQVENGNLHATTPGTTTPAATTAATTPI
jgi:hypothetical protein